MDSEGNPGLSLSYHASFKARPEISDEETIRSLRRIKINRPPKVRTDQDGPQPIRRTSTLPAQTSDAARRNRGSRRNLSRILTEEIRDEFLVDAGKRTSSRNLQSLTSDNSLKATVSFKSGRAACPLDLPFAPTVARTTTFAVGTRLEDLLGDENTEEPSPIRRTKTSTTNHDESAKDRINDLNRSVRFSDDQKQSQKRMDQAASQKHLKEFKSAKLVRDSAKDVSSTNRSKDKEMTREMASTKAIRKDTPHESLDQHIVTIDGPSRKKVPELSSKSSKKLEQENAEPLTWMEIFLHFIALIFVQYPFKYHKQWLEKMYKTNRLERPTEQQSSFKWISQKFSLKKVESKAGLALPSLPEDGTPRSARDARVRRRTQLDGDESIDDSANRYDPSHRKRNSQSGGNKPMRPPPGHLPRSQNITTNRKKKNRSVEIFGDIMQAIGLNTKGGKFRFPFGLSEMDESELSGFQARLYKFIKRQHKGRLARAWEHMIHPLDSMQTKHRRSVNKTRLLNSIDKYRAQKFENTFDAVKTTMFLLGQWVFEAMSPPKYRKKPMLFTVLFPLVLILFFGFMAGEYPYWLESNGQELDYKFGPTELASWLFKSEKWRTFDDGFLIIWGARYLPLVTTESWRWLFSMLVHENFAHLGGNLMMFVVMSWSLESRYGFFRTGMICWLSGISGNFMSAMLEDSCGIVLGASGCVFGLSAFYIIDVVGDFKSVSFPCLRLIGICIFLSAFIIALTSHQEASHFSHIGGFLCGMGLGVVLVRRFIDERIEACLPWLALVTAITLLCVFPLIVLVSVLPNLQCSS